MAGRGPAPGANPNRKPPGAKRNRNAGPQFEELPAEGFTGDFPELSSSWRDAVKLDDGELMPVTHEFVESTRRWYETWARSPMAVEFTGVDWERLQRVAILVDKFERQPTQTLMAEIRLQEAGFGGTPMDRRRLGKKIATVEPDAPMKKSATVHRLRAVDPQSA